MLRFAENPDIIFTQILNQAFDYAIDLMIRDHLEDKYDADRWVTQLPRASKVFSPETAMITVKELQKGNKDETGLWELNDYHYRLLYDILDEFCEVRNDMGREIDVPFAEMSGFKIWEVNFEVISEIYFPDTDFLIPRERMEDLDEEEKEQFGFRPETFPTTMGLKPHPDELKLKLWEKGNYTPQLPDDSAYRKGTSKYPELFNEGDSSNSI